LTDWSVSMFRYVKRNRALFKAPHIKEVRQTEVAGPIQLRLSAPKGGTSY
jgi:hypothetical protein